MSRAALAAGLVLALAGCASGPGPRDRTDFRPGANPSAVVAAELAFARAAQEDGQWTAFARFADDEAVMFVPEAANAQSWLKGRANPPAAVRWQPHQVWSSCDGSLAATKGAWQRADGTVGYFTTVWQRQRDGTYEWVLDQGDGLAQPLAEPEMIGGAVAECAAGARRVTRREANRFAASTVNAPICDAGQCRGGGVSADGTLVYSYSVAPSGAREFIVELRQDGAMREVLRSTVAAG